MYESYAAIILAAGKGTRIGSHLPKTLYPIAGKPLIHYTIDTLSLVPLSHILVVVGHRALDIKMSIGDRVDYAYQANQLGTGHALQVALDSLSPSIQSVLVLYGDDSAFYEASTIRQFIAFHQHQQSPVSIMTHIAGDPTGLGRIIRDAAGNLIRIVEEKQATAEEKPIHEVNSALYGIDVAWAKENLNKLLKTGGEYYLTDIVSIALQNGQNVGTYKLTNSHEWTGVNTQDQLIQAHQSMVEKLKKMHHQTTVFIDLDNTLIDSESIKCLIPQEIVRRINSLYQTNVDEKTFQHQYETIYENIRQKSGYVDMPEICDRLAEDLHLPSSDPIKSVIYNLPFHSFILPGAVELLEFLRQWSRVVIFSDGDMVFEPAKFMKAGFSSLCHEYYFAETKDGLVRDLLSIYDPKQVVVIDDQLNNLSIFDQNHPNVQTMWFKFGKYKNTLAAEPAYQPMYQTDSLGNALEILKKKVFKWA